MGQKTSKHQAKVAHRSKKRQKSKKYQNNINLDTNNFSPSENDDKYVFGELKQGIHITPQEQNIQRWNNTDHENMLSSSWSTRNRDINALAPTQGINEVSPIIDCQNRNRLRRFRDKLALQLQRGDMKYIVETFLKRDIFSQKEYHKLKNQLHPKWMCWRLSYILELKIRKDDLKGKTTSFDLFLECLRSPQIRRGKLADHLSRESGDHCSSWRTDGKDERTLEFADGLPLTPSLLEFIMRYVQCSDQLSWWRWIPHELGLRNLTSSTTDPESPEMTYESEHDKLKSALHQWGMVEGFAQGGLEILILCFRNHNDACDVNWKGLQKLFRDRNS